MVDRWSRDIVFSCRRQTTIEGTQRTALEEAMAARDARDRGILNAFGILRSPPKAAPSFRAPAPIYVVKGASSGWDRPYAYDAQPNHSKPPHAPEEIAGRVSVDVNCKSPHAPEEIAGRLPPRFTKSLDERMLFATKVASTKSLDERMLFATKVAALSRKSSACLFVFATRVASTKSA
jgi:hypothetical protein